MSAVPNGCETRDREGLMGYSRERMDPNRNRFQMHLPSRWMQAATIHRAHSTVISHYNGTQRASTTTPTPRVTQTPRVALGVRRSRMSRALQMTKRAMRSATMRATKLPSALHPSCIGLRRSRRSKAMTSIRLGPRHNPILRRHIDLRCTPLRQTLVQETQ